MKKNKRFVLDTNTLISAFLLSSNTTSAKAYYKVKQEGIIISSKETFDEFTRVFLRPKFNKYLTEQDRISIIEDLKELVEFIPVYEKINICRDPKDNQYLELAIEAGAACIITGDNDLLVLNPFQSIPILTPSEFLKT